MAQGVASGDLESKDFLKPCHRLHPVLHGLRVGSCPSHGPRVRVSKGTSLRRKQLQDIPRGRVGPAGRSQGGSPPTLRQIPVGPLTIPRATSPRPNLSSQRLGAEAQAEQQGSSQVHAPLGRTLRHRRSPPTRHLQARQRSRGGLQERVEHRTATSLLSLEFCKHIYLFTYLKE